MSEGSMSMPANFSNAGDLPPSGFEPLFGGTPLSEAELSEETVSTENDGADTAGENTGDPQPKADAATDDSKEEKQGDKSAAEETPPAKNVPLAELLKERARRKEMDQQLQALQQKLEMLEKAPPQAKAPDEAPVVKQVKIPEGIQSEFNELADIDPDAAAIAMEDSPDGKLLRKALDTYGSEAAFAQASAIKQRRELEYLRAEIAREKEEFSKQRENMAFRSEVDAAMGELRKSAPTLFNEAGHFDPDSEAAVSLQLFASQNGLGDQLFALTNPETVLTVNGQPQRLGAGAIRFVRFLHDMASLDVESIQKQGAEKATAELLQKMTGQPKRTQTLNNLPKASGEAKNFEGKSYKDMTPEEQRRWLEEEEG